MYINYQNWSDNIPTIDEIGDSPVDAVLRSGAVVLNVPASRIRWHRVDFWRATYFDDMETRVCEIEELKYLERAYREIKAH